MDKKIPIYWSVIGGLIWTAILVITSRLCSNPNAVNYIGFAATITSLVLGVIAIFYSIITSTRSSENIGELKGASKEISDGAKTVSGIADRVNISLTSIEEISQKINQKFEELPQHLENMNIGLKKELKEFYESNVPKKQEFGTEAELNKQPISADFAKNYLVRSSFSGLLFLYACSLAKAKGLRLNMEKLTQVTKIVPNWSSNYYHGFQVASYSAGIINTLFETSKSDDFQILDIDPLIEQNIHSAVYERANQYDNSVNYPTKWVNLIGQVEALYK